ncbi:S8 family serine peptidase [Ralstonia pickettii]|uniref:S8 family serine peptidase n=1 Tax=Ralstonia pickettii TaxID=329 RepID=UPI00046A0FEB|nr:S8 family serine peptidase [Ralstonia pickettii]
MKSIAQGGIVRALVALGLVSYQAAPALAGGDTANAGAQTQWVSQLIVKEKSGANGALQLQSAEPDGRTMRVDVATVQRWSAAAQLPVTYKRAMSGGAHVVTLPSTMTLDDAQAVAQRMAATGQFEYVAPDRILRRAFTPSAAWFSSQWNLMATNATITTIPNSSGPLQPASGTAVGGANLTTAWDTTTGSNTVNVAIVDTGILSHADLTGAKINPGSNFITNTFRNNSGDSIGTDPGDAITATDITSNPTVCNGATPSNSSWHGTFVTGLVAAQHSGTRVAGIAPGVGVQMARALGRCGGAESDIIDAVTWASGGVVGRISPSVNPTPAKVINMSLGGTGSCDLPMQTAITNARNRGAVIVVATGNESASAIDSPANCTGTIAVTAHTLEGDKATYANVGTGTTLSAPGGGNGAVVNGLGALIASLSNTGTTSAGSPGYSGEAGTSMATPHVAGVAALMLSVNSALTPDQIATVLKQSARPFPAGTYCATHAGVCGAGMLDAGAAVALAKGNPSVHASTSASAVVANNAVTLTATGSAGLVNTITSVQWAQTSGPSVSLTTAGPDSNGNYTATFTPSAAGTYAFNVTLTSNTGATATDTANVTVTAAASANTPPAATSSGGGGGGAIGLAGAALLLAAGLAGRRRRAK